MRIHALAVAIFMGIATVATGCAVDSVEEEDAETDVDSEDEGDVGSVSSEVSSSNNCRSLKARDILRHKFRGSGSCCKVAIQVRGYAEGPCVYNRGRSEGGCFYEVKMCNGLSCYRKSSYNARCTP